MTDYVITGGRSSSYPTEHYGAHFTGTRATFCLDADLATPSANVLAIPGARVSVLTASPIAVTDKFFGMSVKDRANDALTGVTAKTTRSHDLADGKGRWQKIEVSQGVFDWSKVDDWTNKHRAAGRDLIFTLFATPAWASARPTEQGIYGASNLGLQAEPANMAHWTAYCSAVATRYLGRIKYYEIWNEPNMNNDGTGPTAFGTSSKRFFFSGTFAKLAEMTRLANQAIKAVDPTAKIICPPVQGWEASGTDNSGLYVTGMLDAPTGDGTTKMKDWVDIFGVHLYLPSGNKISDLVGVIGRVNAAKTTAGVSALETWDTESGPIGPDVNVIEDHRARPLIARMLIIMAAKGIARTIYYQYDHASMGIVDRASLVAYRNKLCTLLASGNILSASVFADGRVAYNTSTGITII